ncbi:MAG: D-alanyl-D-alanine carboxypeptidase [Candidatus Accumulibacter sp.]|jgi:D-alanyl-D-alanine carboxypeptidase (penicillin-binding protein 5/6)|nr:D-alanyl-D-alanine carboxypeptidase [Accumulibacter sp.]
MRIAFLLLFLSTFALAQPAPSASPPVPVAPAPSAPSISSASPATPALPASPALAAKSWLLLEFSSGQELASQAPDERLDPASLTKLMTAYLVFAAMKEGSVKANQELVVSEKAWKTGGSKMFVLVNAKVTTDDLLKGMIVQSGNDASVVLAEALAGTEENFAQMMNREARRLGMESSNFVNSTGMPDPQHFTTARDLAKLAGALIRDFPEEYAKYYSMKEYRYSDITQRNRNDLLFIDPTVDGIKTGHTQSAGFCLVASAKRGARRLLSVVLGAQSESVRTQESLKLLNFGFQAYDALRIYSKGQTVSSLKVWKGASSTVKAGFASDFILAVPKGRAPELKAELVSRQPLMAPVVEAQVVGTMKLTLGEAPYGEYPVFAIETVQPAGFFGRMIDSVRLWFN